MLLAAVFTALMLMTAPAVLPANTALRAQEPQSQATPAAGKDDGLLANLRRRFVRERNRLPRDKRPVAVFREWAKKPKPFGATFLLFIFSGATGGIFFSRRLSVAEECCRQQFWRCLGRAILVATIFGLAVRIAFLMPARWHL